MLSWSILQYFWPALRDNWSWKSILVLFLSGRLRQVLLYRKTCEKRPLSIRPKIGFQDQVWLNAGQKYCRMLQGEHYAILLTFINLPFVIKIFVLSIFLSGRLSGQFTQVLRYWHCNTGTIVDYHCNSIFKSIVTHADIIVWFVHLYRKIIHEL